MADNLVLNPGSGGSTIRTEDVGGGLQMPVTKIHTGANDTDGGCVTATNPLPVQQWDGAGNSAPAGDVAARASYVAVTDGTSTLGTPSHPVRVDPVGTTAQPVTYPARSNSHNLAVNSASLKGSAGVLCSLKMRNRNSGPIYFMLFDQSSPTPPGNGATPLDTFLVPGNSQSIVGTDFFTESGAPFLNGILVVCSSSDATLTITTTAANQDISGLYA